ncbi:MAG: hypothetical protein ACNA7J_06215 [Wenzhouxiangella sp.]
MAEFNLVFDENDEDGDLIASVDESAFNGLLSDEVVMQWLMDLESQESEASAEERQHAHA